MGGVVDSIAGAGEENIIFIEEDCGKAEATGGVDDDHQEYVEGLIHEAKGSFPSDFLRLNVNTNIVDKAVAAIQNVSSPSIRNAAASIFQSPTIQGMLPFKGNSIEAEPSTERNRQNTRNPKPQY